MTDESDATAADVPRLSEPACSGVPPVTADSEIHSLVGPSPARVAQKTLSWPNPMRVGDCTMSGISLTLEANGTASLNSSIESSDDDDAWVIRGGVSLLGSNGAVLFTCGKLDSPTCPQGAAEGWNAPFNFPAQLYGSIASARINDAHC